MSNKTASQVGIYGLLTVVCFLIVAYSIGGWIGVVLLIGIFAFFMFIGSVLIGLDEKKAKRMEEMRRK